MYSTKKTVICGLHLNFASLRRCIEELKAVEVPMKDISILLPDGSIMSAMPIPRDSVKFDATVGIRNENGAAATTYAAHFESMMSGLTQTLFTLGVPVYNSERLEGKIRNGGILASVRCNDSVIEQVREVLIRTGAEDISQARDTKVELERCAIPRKDSFVPPLAGTWQQRGAHA